MIFAATGAQLRYAMFHVKHAASGLNQKKYIRNLNGPKQ